MDRCCDDDDRRRRRRNATAFIAAAASLALVRPVRVHAQARPECIARPEQTEGPYFVDTRLARSDIRSDPDSGRIEPGVPLALTFRVSRMHAGGCEPLPKAHVE